MSNLKILITFQITIILVLTVFFPCINVKAAIQKPNIKVGDYWTYYVSTNRTGENNYGTAKVSIEGKTNLDLDGKGKIVETWIVKTSNPFLQDYAYFTVSNFSWVRSSRESQILTDYEITYTNPDSFWPIELNKKYSYKTDKIVKTLDNENRYENVTLSYECSDELKEITTEVGTFDCYEFKYFDDNNIHGNYTFYRYYSPELNWFVCHKEYNNGKLETETILKSYKGYENSSSEKNKEQTGQDNRILLVGMLIALAITLLIIPIKLYKFKKRRRQK